MLKLPSSWKVPVILKGSRHPEFISGSRAKPFSSEIVVFTTMTVPYDDRIWLPFTLLHSLCCTHPIAQIELVILEFPSYLKLPSCWNSRHPEFISGSRAKPFSSEIVVFTMTTADLHDDGGSP